MQSNVAEVVEAKRGRHAHMKRIVHTQGSPEWKAYRSGHFHCGKRVEAAGLDAERAEAVIVEHPDRRLFVFVVTVIREVGA